MKHPIHLLSLPAAFALGSVAWAAGPAANISATVHTVTHPVGTVRSAVHSTATALPPDAGISGTVDNSVNAAGVVGAAALARTSAAAHIAGPGSALPGTASGSLSAGTAATVHAPGLTAAADLAAGTESESIGMRKARAQLEAEAEAGANSSAIAGQTSATFSVDAAPTVHAIDRAAVAERDDIADRVDAQISAGRDAVAAAGAHARALAGSARDRFDAACAEIATCEDKLHRSIEEAREATADTWEAARSRLAADDAAYVAAVSRAQVDLAAELPNRMAGAALHGTAAVSAAPAAQDLVDEIRSSGFAARTQLATEIDSGVALGHDRVAALRSRAEDLGDQAQARFEAAARTVETPPRQLQTTLRAAVRADADTWSDARRRLAADFRSYADAMQEAQAAATAGLAAQSGSGHAVAAVSGDLAADGNK